MSQGHAAAPLIKFLSPNPMAVLQAGVSIVCVGGRGGGASRLKEDSTWHFRGYVRAGLLKRESSTRGWGGLGAPPPPPLGWG